MKSFCSLQLLLLLLLATLVAFTHGRSISPQEEQFKIVGGRYAHIKRFPYTVAIYKDFPYTDDVLFGGGAIINDNWIVTSARQFQGLQYAWNPVTVRTGSDYWQSGGQAILSAKVIFHPDYKSDGVDNDIALIKLNSSLHFGKTVKPVRLPSAYPRRGCRSFVTGWGLSKMLSGEVTSKQLKAGRVRVKRPAICQKMYPNMNFTTQHVCADSKNVGPCTFDIGDPLVCKHHLIGLFIGGDICNEYKLIDVYTNVAFHRQWILDTISKNSNEKELAKYEKTAAYYATYYLYHGHSGNNDGETDDDDEDDDDDRNENEEMENKGNNSDGEDSEIEDTHEDGNDAKGNEGSEYNTDDVGNSDFEDDYDVGNGNFEDDDEIVNSDFEYGDGIGNGNAEDNDDIGNGNFEDDDDEANSNFEDDNDVDTGNFEDDDDEGDRNFEDEDDDNGDNDVNIDVDSKSDYDSVDRSD